MPAKTVESVRQEVMDYVKALVKYWSEQNDKTNLERCEGLAFSILVMIDGGTFPLPAMDLVLRPHFDDKQFCIETFKDWYEDGMVINDDCQLHDLLCQKEVLGGQDALDNMTDEQRLAFFDGLWERYCYVCGTKHPEHGKCQCCNDE